MPARLSRKGRLVERRALQKVMGIGLFVYGNNNNNNYYYYYYYYYY